MDIVPILLGCLFALIALMIGFIASTPTKSFAESLNSLKPIHPDSLSHNSRNIITEKYGYKKYINGILAGQKVTFVFPKENTPSRIPRTLHNDR